MGYDDLFEHHEKVGYRRDFFNRHHDHHREGYSGRSLGNFPGKQHYAMYIVNRIWSNRKLRFLFVLSGIILVVLIILVLIAIVPLVVRIYDSVMQNGLQSIVDSVTGFLGKLWTGAGK
jgi:hypothetical protein